MAVTYQDENVLATVLHVLSKKPLIIDDIAKLSLEEQSNILTLDDISTIEKRKAITSSLFTKIPDLKNTAYKRIRFKSLLSAYYKAHIELNSVSLQQWNTTQLPLSLLYFVVDILQKEVKNIKDEKSRKKQRKDTHSACKFVYYLRQFCKEEPFGGEQLYQFWSLYSAKAAGFALKFVKKICEKYDLKYGQFAKVKKWVGTWITTVTQKKKSTETKPTAVQTVIKAVDDKKEKEPPKQVKAPEKTVVTTVSAPVKKPQTLIAGSQWYWMDMEEFCWTLYNEPDQQLLNVSYANGERKCDVEKGKYRVEFEIGTAAGTRYENDGDDDEGHMVVRAEPEDGEIHGMPVSDD